MSKDHKRPAPPASDAASKTAAPSTEPVPAAGEIESIGAPSTEPEPEPEKRVPVRYMIVDGYKRVDIFDDE